MPLSSPIPSPTGQTTGFVKLPPIISNELDRTFLTELSEFIDGELQHISAEDQEQRYVVHQTAFNKIIEYVTSYKPILTDIKKEYEETIDAIKKGQKEAMFLTGKLKAMASEPSTLRNYRRRADQLDERVEIVHKDNERLRAEIAGLRESRLHQEKREKDIQEPQVQELKKDKRLLPGLTLEQSTNLSLLHSKLDQLGRQFKELNISFKTRYVPKSHKESLKVALEDKVAQRDKLQILCRQNRARQERLEIAVAAAQEYNRYKPPHQTVGDAVTLALAKAAGEKAAALLEKAEQLAAGGDQEGRVGSPSANSTFEEDDPSREKEAEMMLDYIEKFNELFEYGKFGEAAVHAANSPKGILRTLATLSKFKEVRGWFGGRSPLLSFCDALVSSVPAIGVKPDAVLSLECVRCAVSESRLDLLSHWVGQDRLTVSMEMGEVIQAVCGCKDQCCCGCQALAQNVYTTLAEHTPAVESMLRQQRVQAAVEYAGRNAFTRDQYKHMLEVCPTLQLAHLLIKGQQLLPLGVAVQTLLDSDEEPDKGIELLTDVHFGSAGMSLKNMVWADKVTPHGWWLEYVCLLRESGQSEAAVQLLAAATVQQVIQTALSRM